MRTPAPSFRQHHHRFIHLLFSFLIGSYIIVTDALEIVTNRSDLPAKCPPFQCGDGGVLIEYPFSPPMGLLGSNYSDDYYCGYQDLSVSCSGDTPRFNTSTDSYVVKAINYTKQTMTLIDADVLNEDCPKVENPWNKSYTDILVLSPSDVQLEFFFDCTPQEQFAPNLVVCLAQKIGSGVSYVFPVTNVSIHHETRSILSKACRGGSVTSTVLSERWDGIEGNVSRFGSVLQQGFELTWKKTIQRDCAVCEKSNGSCGYVNETGLLEFRCYCKDGRVDSTDCTNKSSLKKILAIALPVVFGFLVLAGLCFVCYKRRKGGKIIFRQTSSTRNSFIKTAAAFSLDHSKYSTEVDIESQSSSPYLKPPHIFTYKELDEATDGFHSDREIGDGGFGTVYKGFLRDGRTVAVKRLYENNHKRLEQFLNEVKIVEPLRHPNLVTLYGCTSHHSRELLLVYEFVCNGTVADHLHGPRASERVLTWPLRMKTAIGAADALAHLHAIEPPVIHRDVKTNNILLDDSFHVKVADFGLSRLFPLDATHVSTAPQGTPGYVDPDYYNCYQLTDKSDVYSLGVVLVELISSKPAVDITRKRQDINLSKMAIDKITKGLIHELADPELGYQTDPEVKRQIQATAQVAFLCLQSEKDMRPPMKLVKTMLCEILTPPHDGPDGSPPHDGPDGPPPHDGPDADKKHSGLLEGPVSPDTVTSKWYSRVTTPNSSV